MKIINIFFVLITLYIFSGCVNKIPFPKISIKDSYAKILDPINGYYENKVGGKNKIVINNSEFNSKHSLLRWPKNNYKTICFSNRICLIDTLNNNSFSHSAVMGREELYPLVNPVKYLETDTLASPIIFHNPKVQVGSNTIYIPSLNTISTREVGESMYEKINQFTFDTYTTNLNQDVSVQSGDEYGENIQKFDLNLSGKYEILKWPENGYKTICGKNNVCLVDVNNNNSFSHSAIKNESKLYPLNTPIKYKSIQDVDYNEDSFKYQVLYQGKVANKIKISFREFKNDMARPAFTQDIEYELEGNKPTIIGFKGLRIEVKKATNLNITYSVIKDYN